MMMESSRALRRALAPLTSRALTLVVLLALAAAPAFAQRRILVYTRNFTPDGKGYVHENIAASVAAIRRMGTEKGFAVDVSDDPTTFTDANLKQYAALVFSNSNNEAFATEDQKDAFKRYIQSGGGFVGIHSASGSQRDWPYFWSVVGGKFVEHPKLQPFVVHVVDSMHVIAKDLPEEFQWSDEAYFTDHVSPDIHPVLVIDRSLLQGTSTMKSDVASYRNPLPLAWWHTFDGGREYYIALGHKKEDYENPILYELIANGIAWAMTK